MAQHGQQACPCLSSRAVQAAGGQHCAVHWGVGHRGAAAQARRGKQAAAGTTFTLRGSRSSWITVCGVVGTPCNPPPWSGYPPSTPHPLCCPACEREGGEDPIPYSAPSSTHTSHRLTIDGMCAPVEMAVCHTLNYLLLTSTSLKIKKSLF